MSTMISRHPDSTTLMSYAAGGLKEPLAAIVCAHVSMCDACQIELRDLELIGEVLIESAPVGASINDAGVDDVIVPLSPPDMPRTGHVVASSPATSPGALDQERLPLPIVKHYGLTFDTIPWKRLGPGVWHHKLPISPGSQGDLRLLKIAAGRSMPEHGHGGAELTLVLDGAYADETGQYGRGDVQDVDEDVEHRPVAHEDEGCICLIASERPGKFKGLIGKLMQPWTGM